MIPTIPCFKPSAQCDAADGCRDRGICRAIRLTVSPTEANFVPQLEPSSGVSSPPNAELEAARLELTKIKADLTRLIQGASPINAIPEVEAVAKLLRGLTAFSSQFELDPCLWRYRRWIPDAEVNYELSAPFDSKIDPRRDLKNADIAPLAEIIPLHKGKAVYTAPKPTRR